MNPAGNQVLLPVVLPLLVAFLLQPLSRLAPVLARLAGPAILLASIALLFARWSAPAAEPFVVAIGGFAPPLGVVFYVDRLALLFALAVPLFGLIFWGWADTSDVEGRTRADALMLLLVAGATGLALSGDLFNVYVFYELMAVASFGLVTLNGTGRAQIATIRYLLVSAFGSLLALTGIAILYTQTGTLNLAHIGQLAPAALQGPAGLLAFAFILVGFGVKAELFPVNTWVPEVYATAPARVAGLLAGLISKLSVLVVVRLLVLAYAETRASELLLVLGTLTILFGELSAWRARDFPRMLGFSSVGQLGIVFIAFSIPGPWGLLAGLAVALHHLLIKSALFSLAQRWSGSFVGLAGAARQAPIASGLFVLFALSLIGVPPLPGFWTKILVLAGLAQQGSALHMTALGAVLLVTAIEANYLFRFATTLFGAGTGATKAARHGRTEIAIAAAIGLAVLVVTIQIDPIGDELREIADQAADRGLYIATVFPAADTEAATGDRP